MSIFTKGSDYETFVGKNFDYYSIKWDKLLQNKYNGDIEKFKNARIFSISFNLSALIFCYFWMFYRRMYSMGFKLIIATVASLLIHPSAPTIVSILICVICGLFGNQFYFSFVSTKIDKIKKETSSEEIAKSKLKLKGGTSKLAVIGFLILFSIIISIAVAIQAGSNNTFSSASSNNKTDNVPYNVKSTIEEMTLRNNFSSTDITVKDIAANLAGANGKIEWKADGNNNYYINIIQPDNSRTDYMKFTYNPNTDYIILTEMKVKGNVCKGENRALECFGWVD